MTGTETNTRRPRGERTRSSESATAAMSRRPSDSAVLAANQGLYNGFLAAGLIWGVFYQWPLSALHIKTFFLACVIVAGAYGAVTVSRRILVVQALPALVGFVLVLAAS